MIEANIERVAFNVPVDPAVSEIATYLRGEISAIEAYEQVMESMAHDPDATRLRDFIDDHVDAVAYWKTRLSHQGMAAEESSGPWGTAVVAFVGAAKLMGNHAALAALKQGEEHGLAVYEEALGSEQITETQKAFVRDVLIPHQRRHVHTLEEFKKQH